MNEVVEQGVPIKKAVITLISFASSNMEIVTVQDVMYCLQLATYWLNRGIAQYYGPSDSRDIHQEIQWAETNQGETLPEEATEQLKYIHDTINTVVEVVQSKLDNLTLDQQTKFCLTNASTNLIEATFNTRMTQLAYEGLQSIRRSH